MGFEPVFCSIPVLCLYGLVGIVGWTYSENSLDMGLSTSLALFSLYPLCMLFIRIYSLSYEDFFLLFSICLLQD